MLQRYLLSKRIGEPLAAPAVTWLLPVLVIALAVGCGGNVVVFDERHDDGPAPIRCHTGYELVDGVCQVKEIYFAGGTCIMGRGYCYPPEEHAEEFDDGRCWMSDQPHEVTVGPFYMDAVEMVWFSEVALQKCPTKSLDCRKGEVGWYASNHISESDEMCAEMGKRLPTEAEWEFAATAGGTRTYPWGDEAPTCELANFDVEQCGHFGTEIARFPPTPEGLYDMAGNVAEYVLPRGDEDEYDDYYTEGYPPPGIEDPQVCGYSPCVETMVRGGCDGSEAHELRGAHRHLGWEVDSGGFRCVRDP